MRRLLLLALCLPIGAIGAATSRASAATTVVPPTTRPASPTTRPAVPTTAARPRPPSSTTAAPTTTSTTAPSAITVPGTDAVPAVTTPVPPKGGQISPLFAWLGVGGVVTTLALIGLQVILTRNGRRGRWTL